MVQGYLLSRDHLEELGAVVRAHRSTPLGQRKLRRRLPVFQPTAAGKVYQCVHGMRLKYGTVTDPESKILKEASCLCVCIGDVSIGDMRTFDISEIAELRAIVIAAGAMDASGIIVPQYVDTLRGHPKIAEITAGVTGKAVDVEIIRLRCADGYFGTGSIVVGNDAEGWYGLGSQVFRAALGEEVEGTTGKYYATLRPDGFNAEFDKVVVWDRESAFSSGDDAYVMLAKPAPFEGAAVDNETWQETEAGTLPMFEAISSPGGSGASVAVGTAEEDAVAGETCDFDIGEDDPVTASVADGLVIDTKEYNLVEFDSGWVVIDPELGVTGTAGGDYSMGDTDTFSVAGNSVEAEVILGDVENGEDYELQWSVDHWIALGTPAGTSSNPNFTGTADTFIDFGDGSGTFTTSDGTKTATISRGCCIAGKEYGLVWADDDHYAVIDPEMEVLVVPTALKIPTEAATCTVYSGATKGSESSVSETIDAYVRKGLVFSGKKYRAIYVDQGWEIDNASTEFDGEAAGDIALNATETQLIFAGSLGSESSSGISVSVKNTFGPITSGARVRVAWCDWADGWEFVNARCPT